MNQDKIRDCFNKAQESYDHHCDIQIQTSISLINELKKLNLNPKNIIDLGCGTGITTKYLINLYKTYHKFYAIDIADKLLSKARIRLEEYNIVFKEISLEAFFTNKDLSYDLVFSNMVFQWSDNLGDVLEKIYRNLNSQAILAFSIVLYGTYAELNSTIYFNKFEDIRSLLLLNKFKIIKSELVKSELQFSSKINAAKSIRAVGANYHNKANSDFKELLRDRRSQNQNFSLTYNIGSFIAIKS
jgi:malonyl-CoA O-methyltransferase